MPTLADILAGNRTSSPAVPQGASAAQVNAATNPVLNAFDAGWYVVRTTTGYIGLVLHHNTGQAIDLGNASYGTVTHAQLVGNPSQSITDVLGSAGTKVSDALHRLGATAQQSSSFITQADTAAGKEQGHPQGGIWGFVTGLVGATPFVKGKQTTQLLISPTGEPKASSGKTPVSTTPSGDVQSVGASAALPSTPFAFLTSLAFWKGIGLVLAGALILIFVGLMLYKAQT